MIDKFFGYFTTVLKLVPEKQRGVVVVVALVATMYGTHLYKQQAADEMRGNLERIVQFVSAQCNN